ncbi:MAG: Peptidase C1-like family [Pseudomonadota bacterium]|jgi:hypothetical protein
MILSRAAYASLSAAWLFVSACGQSPNTPQSSIETVNIPQTDVRDQGRFGICWAYGTTGLIESELLKSDGIKVDISEEALAFEHMAEALRSQFATATSSDLLDFITRGELPEGWATRTTPDLAAMYMNSKHVQHDALALIKLRGAVPESAWSFKVSNYEQKRQLTVAVRDNTRKLWQAGYRIQDLSVEQIKDLILVGEYGTAFPSRPPAYFEWNGETISALDYVKTVLKFDPDAWEAVAIRKAADVPQFIQTVKQSLALGHSVPLAFPINVDRIAGDAFRADADAKNYNWADFGRDGGHLVLVTDFINKGGSRGAVSDTALQNELAKPADELDALLFKNSWGVGAKFNEAGKPVGTSVDGYYRMELSYLVGIAKIPEATKNPWAATLAVVPRELAEAQSVVTPAPVIKP